MAKLSSTVRPDYKVGQGYTCEFRFGIRMAHSK